MNLQRICHPTLQLIPELSKVLNSSLVSCTVGNFTVLVPSDSAVCTAAGSCVQKNSFKNLFYTNCPTQQTEIAASL